MFLNLIFIIFICLCCTELLHAQERNMFYPYNYAEREGSCPPLLTRQVCWNSCYLDYTCPEGEKCCETSCGGKVCSRTVSNVRNEHLVKPGLCPNVPEGPWFCSSTCRFDSDCSGSKKCCRNKCGADGCYKPIPTA